MEQGKLLGIIGGMGSFATAQFFNTVLDLTDAETDQEHLDILIKNHASLPDRTNALIVGGRDILLETLVEDARQLEANGCDYIVMTCNTSHAFIEPMIAAVKTEFIHMIRETAAYAAARFGTGANIGILATNGCIAASLYQTELDKLGLKCTVPDEKHQDTVMDIIYGQVKRTGIYNIDDFNGVVVEMDGKGCDAYILGCTELSLIKARESLGDKFIDSSQVLAIKCILNCGKKLKPGYFSEF